MDSLSLRRLLEGRTRRHRQFVRSGLGPWRMAWDGRYKLVRGYDPQAPRSRLREDAKAEALPVLLFDLENDPWELHNLADDPAAAAHRQRLESLLLKARKAVDDPVDFEGVGGKASGPPPGEKKAAKKAQRAKR